MTEGFATTWCPGGRCPLMKEGSENQLLLAIKVLPRTQYLCVVPKQRPEFQFPVAVLHLSTFHTGLQSKPIGSENHSSNMCGGFSNVSL